ncbi:hypothetical protein Ddye_014913 [Dipteronia dyeriana]|uniref:hAT-like transposase RNase-H fold domain-containing protein n=1 Tax=Dipteronia dyeriana TaxID=168575 RepID=A0AAD9U4E6_9ROSI|nr:hypothetical protein Ddye_014913 [Dipteronia dyeriana]
MDSNDINNFEFGSESMEEEYDGETQVPSNDDTGKRKKVVQSKFSRKRKETSKVWKVFVKLPRGKDGRLRCKCKGCSATYLCESVHGTGNMIRYMNSCTKLAHHDLKQMLLNKSSQGDMVASNRRDLQVVRDIISAAIVCHDLPFKFVEWTWIKRLTEYLCDDVNLVSRNTAKADVMMLFSREKQKIKTMLENTPGRICLTCDLWTSINTDGFLCLTTHFLDGKWILQKKVFSTYMLLKQNKESSDVFLQKMITQMYNKYYKYWGEFSVVLAIALILDPHYKMTFIEFDYKKVYGINSPELENVRNKLLFLFNEYMSTSMSTKAPTSLPSANGGGGTNISVCEGDDIFTSNIMLSLLKPDVVEAIVCTRDWMQMDNVSASLEVEEICEDILNFTIEDSPGPSTESATSQLDD